MFATGITRSVITAKVGNQPGSGKVEARVPDWNETMDEMSPRLTGNPVDVLNPYEMEIPVGIEVAIGGINKKIHILNFDQKCSVRVDGDNWLYFLTEFPAARDGLEIEIGAWVEVPMNVSAWPEGARRPESVLCRSTEDPKHYKIFKYRNEIEGTEWEETGLNFGGTFSKQSWQAFAASLPAVRVLQAIPDDEGD